MSTNRSVSVICDKCGEVKTNAEIYLTNGPKTTWSNIDVTVTRPEYKTAEDANKWAPDWKQVELDFCETCASTLSDADMILLASTRELTK